MGKNSTTYTNLTHLLNLDNLLQPFDPTTCVHDPCESRKKKRKKRRRKMQIHGIELSARSSIKEKSRNVHIHFADRFNEATYP